MNPTSLAFAGFLVLQAAPSAPTAAGPAAGSAAGAPTATTASRADSVVIDRIVAVVNKNVVLQSEVETLLDQMMQADPVPAGGNVERARETRRAEILDGLIAEKLLEEEVKKLRVDVTEAEIDRVVQNVMKDNGLEDEQLKQALQRQGLTLDEYREGLKKQLTKMKIIQLKVKSRVQVDDAQVKSAINQRAVLDAADYRVRARHILFLVPPGADDAAQEKRAREALRRAQSGEDFAALAKSLSEDPGTKERGGDLGEFGRGEMVPEFERAAYAAEPGKPAGPVKTAFGWHVLLVEARVPLQARTGPALEEDIRRRLFETEVEQQFRSYVEELKRDAHIERRL